jgi:hypothetical protein
LTVWALGPRQPVNHHIQEAAQQQAEEEQPDREEQLQRHLLEATGAAFACRLRTRFWQVSHVAAAASRRYPL